MSDAVVVHPKFIGLDSIWHNKAPFTLHVGPGKLPENCAFCVNANTSRDWSRVEDLVTLPGSVPERALCEQKPDQCRKGCVVVMTHFIVRLFYQLFWRQINVHTTKKCVNWNEAAIRELLTIRAEAEIVRQFSEMVRGALYTSHEMSRVFTGSLRVVCECTHRFRKITGSVNEPKSDHPGMIPGTHYPCIFRNLCVKEP